MIQVWFNSKKMGALNLRAPADGKPLRITEATGPIFGKKRISENTFLVRKRHQFVDSLQLAGTTIETHARFVLGLDLDGDTVIAQDWMRDGYTVTWPMIVAKDIDEYEYLSTSKISSLADLPANLSRHISNTGAALEPSHFL